MSKKVTDEAWEAHLENQRKKRCGEWYFSGWYRVTTADGKIWAETSSKTDITGEPLPEGARIEKLMTKETNRWDSVPLEEL